ncbi:rhodanese-like domain-containing protein [Nafulsella turpanensis]|uniref:rhodanese-like domain-containing protein n=1 Tax=Nafulsella turpanensis TaxID=1265690 RepID=UPI0004759C72|nr:rhodanese-like domain-containing protein [Nafulsella turpanensis]
MKSLQVHELKQRLQYGEKWLILDVRQPEEYAICNFEGVAETVLMPLNRLHSKELELPQDRPIVVTCHHGVRSRYAIEYLESLGFTKLYNLEGGIHAWATEVNDQMPVY